MPMSRLERFVRLIESDSFFARAQFVILPAILLLAIIVWGRS